MPRAALSQADIDDFRERLCVVAERRFAEQGYAGVTLRGLAADLGVSPMTPYRYFRDKEAIFAAVRAAGFRRFADAQEAAFASERDPGRRLRALGRSYLAFARREPHAYRIMFEMNPLARPDDHAELTLQQRRGWEPLRRAVDDAVCSGLVAGDPAHVAHVVWAGMHGVVSLHLAGTYARLGEDVEHVVDALETVLFDGHRARRARGRARRR